MTNNSRREPATPTGSRWASPAAAVRAANGWPACAAGCGWPLDPAAAAGGHDRHPGCDDLAPVIPLHRQRTRQRTA